jgi:precorrin-2/cobalt-factor-2 C20-methyltransferase
MTGTLYGIGLGPGDPELLTLKAYRVLREVALVYVPVARRGAQSYARTIAAPYLDPPRQRITELVFSMHADEEGKARQWRENAAIMARDLDGGASAAFLTAGDPMLYSTFLHVTGALRELRPDLPVVAIPGVSSPHAAAAAALVPLADCDERLAVLPASYEDGRLREAFESFDTVVLLKVARVIDRVLDLLEELDLIDGATYVGHCGRPEETIVRDVRNLRGQNLDYFSLLIVRRKP